MAIVLSLFDGKSSGYTACELAGIKVDKYYAAEIDKFAIRASNAIHPDVIQLGDITKWREWNIEWDSIDLILAGSPCQGFSFAGKQLALDDPRSKLFFEFIDIRDYLLSINSKAKWMLENVEMKKDVRELLNEHIGAKPIHINSMLVSAQSRPRNYWSNWEIPLPEDRHVYLSDILEKDLPSCGIGGRIVGRRLNELGKREDYNYDIPISQYLELRKDNKANCLTTVYKDSVVPYFKTDKRLNIKFNQNKASCLTGGAHSGGNHSDMDILVIDPDICRRYSVREAFRLQTIPEHHIDLLINSGVSNSQLYKIAGNGWTEEVIAHNLKYSGLSLFL